MHFTKQHNALMAHDTDLSNSLRTASCGSRLDISHLYQGQYPKWDQVPYSVTVSCLIIVAPLQNATLARWRGPAQWPKLQLLRADQCKKMPCCMWIQCFACSGVISLFWGATWGEKKREKKLLHEFMSACNRLWKLVAWNVNIDEV